MMTIRELTSYLLRSCGDIDDKINVKICRIDKDNCVTEIAICPIIRIDSYDNICIYEKDINWQPYH